MSKTGDKEYDDNLAAGLKAEAAMNKNIEAEKKKREKVESQNKVAKVDEKKEVEAEKQRKIDHFNDVVKSAVKEAVEQLIVLDKERSGLVEKNLAKLIEAEVKKQLKALEAEPFFERRVDQRVNAVLDKSIDNKVQKHIRMINKKG